MVCFEVIILGGLGGPSEFSTQCFMVRPLDSDNLKSICIDGGAGVGHIMDTLLISDEDRNVTIEDFNRANDDFNRYFNICHNKDSKDVNYNVNPDRLITKRVRYNTTSLSNVIDTTMLGFSNKVMGLLEDKPTVLQKAYRIYQGIISYFITHPHLDHINGMILNSPLLVDKEVESKKTIYGLDFTTNALKSCIFNDIIWPNLSDSKIGKLQIETLNEYDSHQLREFPEWEIVPFRLCHGVKITTEIRSYSTVYLVRNKVKKNAIIFFGDMDYDQILVKNNNKVDLLNIFWNYLVEAVPLANLSGIFIECSSSSKIKDKQLYGHLSPKHLISALRMLYDKYLSISNSKNSGDNKIQKFKLNVIITHVKMVADSRDSRETILEELKLLAKEHAELQDITFYLALNKYRFVL
ncbi:3',5'-cyclic-nucleotide phosphodiesterase PDE1 PWA37_001826 [Arxiozyma heterogenica]|uniref:3',5'-cyclic-nucleotide phosphodiesterase PDE1 n=1 Tax=Arxiozyma heterogenica TaxID=278026 RepID=UPI002F1EAAAE